MPLESPFEIVGGSLEVQSGDFDGDQDVDIVISQRFDSLLLLRNQGSQFQAEPLVMGEGTLHEMAAADVDGDGDLDLGASWTTLTPNPEGGNFSDVHLSFYMNDGSGTFDEIRVPYKSERKASPLTIAWADMDRDGDLDIVASSLRQSRLFWIEHELNQMEEVIQKRHLFEKIHEIAEIHLPQEFALGDLENDGDFDLAVASPVEGLVVIRQDEGQWLSTTVSADDREGVILIVDLNSDGINDILSGNEESRTLEAFYGRVNDLSFEKASIALLPQDPINGVSTADFNGDGHLDIVLNTLSAQNSTSLQFLQLNSTLFGDRYRKLEVPTGKISALHLTDIDGNGFVDAVTGESFDGGQLTFVEYSHDEPTKPSPHLQIQRPDIMATIQFTWQSKIGFRYQLESSEDLAAWAAAPFVAAQGTGGPLNLSLDRSASSHQFYRLVSRPSPSR